MFEAEKPIIPFKRLNYQSWPKIDENPDLKTAVQVSIKAGRMLHKAFYSQYEPSVKADQSEFTPFDERAERIASRFIKQTEPGAVIMGEEISPDEDISGRIFWVIDGIDGTTNFSRGIPICNFTLAKAVEGRIRLGVVFDFLNGDLFYAIKDGGAYRNGEPIQVKERPFRESLITYAPLLDVGRGKAEYEHALVEALWSGMKEITTRSGRFQREFQSGGLELAWVASGKLDGYASSWTSPWDLSAGVLLVREGKGKATNILNEDWEPSYMGVIAGTQTVHPEMIKVLKSLYQHFQRS